jgi:hypothetical protein
LPANQAPLFAGKPAPTKCALRRVGRQHFADIAAELPGLENTPPSRPHPPHNFGKTRDER